MEWLRRTIFLALAALAMWGFVSKVEKNFE